MNCEYCGKELDTENNNGCMQIGKKKMHVGCAGFYMRSTRDASE